MEVEPKRRIKNLQPVFIFRFAETYSASRDWTQSMSDISASFVEYEPWRE